MLGIIVNYKEEINIEYFKKYSFVEIISLNEKKWPIFWYRFQKLLLENKYDMVLHFWLCWWKNSNQIWEIYKIDRSYLFYKDIIDNQRSRFGKYVFQNISNTNIVTKFSLGRHENKLYDFADIFDLETFWISQLSVLSSTPIFSIKWVSDTNDHYLYEFSRDDEIEFLLTPDVKRKRKQIIMEKLKESIDIVNKNFINFFENEFLWFYEKYTTDRQFKKKIMTIWI